MKTAMEKKTGLMRLIGYLSFVVVLLYGITLFAVSCDNDEDPPLPPAVEKVVLAFGVDQGEGQLSANSDFPDPAAPAMNMPRKGLPTTTGFSCVGIETTHSPAGRDVSGFFFRK